MQGVIAGSASWGTAPLDSNAGVVGSERFWFDLASRSSFDVDQIYWEVLYKEGLGEAVLNTATLSVKEKFLRRKKDQFETYWAEKENDPALTSKDVMKSWEL